MWQPGSWEWDAAGARYAWHAGHFIARRPGATRFVAGKWVQTGGSWAWRRAHWR